MQLELAENSNFPYVFVPLKDGGGIFVHQQRLNEALSASIFKKIGKGIKNIGKEVGKTAKKVGLSIPRQAFLGLVEINVHGLASHLKKLIEKGKSSKLEKFWTKDLGGKWGSLKGAIDHGSKRKHLFESYEPLALEPVTATAVATSAPILMKILGFIKEHGPEILDAAKGVKDLVDTMKAGHGGELPPDPTTPEGQQIYDKESHKDPDKGGMFGSIPTPVIIGGLALVAILLMRKK